MELSPSVNRDVTNRVRPINGIACAPMAMQMDISYAIEMIKKLDKRIKLYEKEEDLTEDEDEDDDEEDEDGDGDDDKAKNGNNNDDGDEEGEEKEDGEDNEKVSCCFIYIVIHVMFHHIITLHCGDWSGLLFTRHVP